MMTGEKHKKTPIGIAATLQNLSITGGKDACRERVVKESFAACAEPACSTPPLNLNLNLRLNRNRNRNRNHNRPL